MINMTAVSYTHLDVYKRQPSGIWFFLPFSRSSLFAAMMSADAATRADATAVRARFFSLENADNCPYISQSEVQTIFAGNIQ